MKKVTRLKYTYFGFNQAKAVDMGLDLIDLAILRYFIDFKDSGSMVTKIVDGVPYYWVKYDAVVESNPIYNIKSKRAIARRFDRLVGAKVLTKYLLKEKGNYTLFGIGSNYRELIYTSVLKDTDLCTQKYTPMDSEVQTKDSSIKDSSIKDTLSPTEVGQEEENLKKKDLEKIITAWNNNAKGDIREIRGINRNTKRYERLNARYKETSLEEILEAIDNISKSKFLQGDNLRRWSIDFDWLVRPNNFIKVLEGNFNDNEPKAESGPSSYAHLKVYR